MFKTAVLANYPGASEICAFIRHYESNPHALCRCDGSLRIYHRCKYVIELDRSISKYGLDSYATYGDAKAEMRKAQRAIRKHKRNKEITYG